MRDTFLLLWVGFLVIGVIGSIVSSIRKQAQRAQAEPPKPRRIPSQWQPPPGQLPELLQRLAAQVTPPPKPVAPKAPPPKKSPPAASPPELPHDFPPARRPTQLHLFRDRKAIVQAVIAAEVLGKPRALRDEYF